MHFSGIIVNNKRNTLSKSTYKFMENKTSKFSRRTIALFWCLMVAVVIGFLIYFEQIALLYVIATLGLVLLLFIVAFADLENIDRDAVAGYVDQ